MADDQSQDSDSGDEEKPYIGRNQLSYCTTELEDIIKPTIKPNTPERLHLQLVLSSDIDKMIKAFEDLKTEVSDRHFKYECMLAFWLAIDQEKTSEACELVKLDPLIKTAVKNLRKNGAHLLQQRKEMEDAKAKKAKKDNSQQLASDLIMGNKVGVDDLKGPIADKVGKSIKLPKINNTRNMQKQGEDEDEGDAFKDLESLKDFKYIMKKRVGAPLVTNCLRVALNFQEESLASKIIADYKAKLDQRMMERAIKTDQLQFLYTVFAYNKNYECLTDYTGEEDESTETEDDDDSKDSEHPEQTIAELDAICRRRKVKYMTYTFDWLIALVIELTPNLQKQQETLSTISAWRILGSENFLMSMLTHRQDQIACDFSKQHIKDANEELMVFTLSNQNELFLKFALSESVFNQGFVNSDEVVEEMLSILESRAKTELILNCLIYAEWSKWKTDNVESLIGSIGEMTSETIVEMNRILLTYNPIQTICLSCQILDSIGSTITLYAHECNSLCEDLQGLGEKIIESFEDGDVLQSMFMDVDFEDRTVLNLVTYQELAPLMSNERVTALIDKLWVGKQTYDCDGKSEDYSMLSFLARAPIQKLPYQAIEFSSLLGRKNFDPRDNMDGNFTFQYKFRKISIGMLFSKNLISAVAQLFVFQQINLEYLSKFNIPVLNALSAEDRQAKITENLDAFRTWCLGGTIVSISCMISVVCQFWFNARSKYNVPFDKWSVCDFLNASCNLVYFIFFNFVTAENYSDWQTYISAGQLIMVSVSWMRFTSFLLVISSYSGLLMTLQQMMVDAVTFICIVISYLLLMTPVCMILMQEMSSFYNTFMSSLFALWDATIGGPSLGGNMHLLYISVSIFHATLANVYLLNYLIAILSTVYEEMLEKGNFGPMSNKYMYIERYLIPMKYQSTILYINKIIQQLIIKMESGSYSLPSDFGYFEQQLQKDLGASLLAAPTGHKDITLDFEEKNRFVGIGGARNLDLNDSAQIKQYDLSKSKLSQKSIQSKISATEKKISHVKPIEDEKVKQKLKQQDDSNVSQDFFDTGKKPDLEEEKEEKKGKKSRRKKSERKGTFADMKNEVLKEHNEYKEQQINKKIFDKKPPKPKKRTPIAEEDDVDNMQATGDKKDILRADIVGRLGMDDKKFSKVPHKEPFIHKFIMNQIFPYEVGKDTLKTDEAFSKYLQASKQVINVDYAEGVYFNAPQDPRGHKLLAIQQEADRKAAEIDEQFRDLVGHVERESKARSLKSDANLRALEALHRDQGMRTTQDDSEDRDDDGYRLNSGFAVVNLNLMKPSSVAMRSLTNQNSKSAAQGATVRDRIKSIYISKQFSFIKSVLVHKNLKLLNEI